MTLGQYIKELRTAIKMSQNELGDLSGVSVSEISRIESGQRQNPSPHILRAIAPHLGISMEELMKVAGYTTEVISRGSFEDIVHKDESGNIIDTYRRKITKILNKDEDLINILARAVNRSSDEDIDTIKKVLEGFTKGGLSQQEKNLLRNLIDTLSKK
ncbi:helix-turn-helix domain-containing protein [Acidaminobacter hydrogenoformans]|uniref:Transcriptional regulator, contains XRE-family HTH domain n=1 Tax=Acidaminobacter hydrogenoformans DSM 2784 TaxID=1120920 RepID=A0A1G5S2V2_9FIRM|nr:helix-turn-helix domain-containing protein [Acidaminobacter hydrogenoformans]SCZ80467.1 Transcriptional regulator, contains XRE-family HTH domain [Acidaminobacter hydrogenoformans DSM 2784]